MSADRPLTPTQEEALRELAQGPFVAFSSNGWARDRKAPLFAYGTVTGLVIRGYAAARNQRIRLTPAGLDACRARGWLPALAKLTKGDSSSPAGGAP